MQRSPPTLEKPANTVGKVTAVVFLVVNLIVDVIYAYLDPRIIPGADQ